MTDGHSLIYHSSTIPCSNEQGEFCPSYRGEFCPPCKNHEGDYVHPVKSFKGDYVHLVKNMKGISSTYAKMSRGDFVQGVFCPTLLYNTCPIFLTMPLQNQLICLNIAG